MSYYRTIQGQDIIGNVIVLGCVTFYHINKFVVYILFFHYLHKLSLQPDEMFSQAE